MIHSTKPIDDATPLDDISGLKLPNNKVYSLKEIYIAEANNIAIATLKYLSAPPSKKLASFSYEWLSSLHEDMFGNVWDWAGKFRHVELSIGIKAYQVPTALKDLANDIAFWDKNKTFDIYEIATRLHHRAVQIHPFQNGNGRWSRMLANIYLRQNSSMPVKWQEDLLSKDNPKRNEYIKALKAADNGDYSSLIVMHKITY
ncbi:MAG: mobile mystery protein B [Sulfurimonas sp. RIFCSPHIGHO2_12_FULL_36_9]|uniref:mobile mystery protein B n=1 Tax=Sulfurimonas sp. RIFCSPLOWO2_12_36_12 TaxID=1802253 RepID=UPI0008B3BA01|nr:mobile mystery protein B [Sulfurimonas sp. RIFCSPLOWO2_12_36_12]OHD96453.1 MAG: mobile mystery protein B [Sulfurimonas sp. RIFCSPHIGHO2_12_FULL_36_9]OHD99569.1 MAG: mobile mystery protein B [Sulfurimonas sp. RIFCSPLOWO2_02_FULL_36_28]OHE02404.1 MAG: mobile mystery protein B [Sulfurimonas sp. RIFCSPLOWO2_12_36_12]OHE07661.1 MAG: mobile mystery protein B [Sulfurimonas sp. RIFCSPLOWO2_12_FULL_36_74]